MRQFKVVDLFAGCGGMSLGFAQAGFELNGAFESWGPAVRVYNQNFGHAVVNIDLGVNDCSESISVLEPDVIIGGPPCQDFSSARANEKTGDRANLTLRFATIVCEVLPLAFVYENVPRAKLSKVYGAARSLYKNAGYGLSEVILDAAYFGVPQRRKRLFLIGVKSGSDNELVDCLEKKHSIKPLSMQAFFGPELALNHYFRVPTNYSKRGVFPTSDPCTTIRAIDRPIPKGYRPHPDDSANIHSGDVRGLTVYERARVQTFPKDFKWTGSKTDLNTMIGNAVPVNLAKHVACVLQKYLAKYR